MTAAAQIPNAITLLRIAAVFPIVWLLRDGRNEMAFWLAFAAGASDGLDGYLARRFGWRSRLGAILDPIADKLLLDGCFLGLWGAGHMPTWLVVLVVGRDVVIVLGAVAYHWLIEPVEARPTLLSKLTTGSQIALVLLWLLHLAWWPVPEQPLFAASVAVGALTAASGLDYVVRWSLKAWRHGGGRKR